MSSMHGFIPVEAVSRRAALRRIALGLTAAGLGGSLSRSDAAQVHAEVDGERAAAGEYEAKRFNVHEFRTVGVLSELVVPADEGGPSAREAGAPEFVDLLCSQNDELADIFTGGMLWLDGVTGERYGKPFADLEKGLQTEVLDALVEAERLETGADTRWDTSEYRRFSVFGVKTPSAMRRGVRFFDWARRLIVDAYYTSPAGIADLGFVGNAAHTKYEVPKDAIDYAMARSPFGEA